MRLPTIAAFTLAAAAATVDARVLHSLLSRDLTTDVCASLTNVALAVKISAGIPPVTIGIISMCRSMFSASMSSYRFIRLLLVCFQPLWIHVGQYCCNCSYGSRW